MKRMTEEQKKECEYRLLVEMIRHVGKSHKIGMGELYAEVFQTDWQHRINHTRPLRSLVKKLRRKGMRICSDTSSANGGYYLASTTSELVDYCDRNKKKALKILAEIAVMLRIALPELLGQMRIDLEEPIQKEQTHEG